MQTHYTIEAQHSDWVVIMIDFLKRYHPKDGHDVTVEVGASSTKWIISRDFVPAADLARLFGVDEGTVKANDFILLEPLDGMDSEIRPTVSYAGHA